MICRDKIIRRAKGSSTNKTKQIVARKEYNKGDKMAKQGKFPQDVTASTCFNTKGNISW